MRLTVLGCQAGVPRHGRASSGHLVADASATMQLDCGPGVATALSARDLRPDAVVVSHLHLDHVHDLLPLAKQLIVERPAVGADLGPPVPLLVPAGARAVLDAWSALFPVPTMPVLDQGFRHAFDVREYEPGHTLRTSELAVTLHAVCDGLLPLARDVDLLLAEATLDAPETDATGTGAHGHLCAADAARLATEAGARQLVLTQAEDAVSAAREVARSGRDAGRRLQPRDRVRVLPRVLDRLARAHPGVTVRLAEQRSGPQLAAVDAGGLDVALAYGAPATPALRSRVLLPVSVDAVVREDHALAGREALAVSDLADEPCVMVRRELRPALHDAVLGAATQAGVALRVVRAWMTPRPPASWSPAAR